MLPMISSLRAPIINGERQQALLKSTMLGDINFAGTGSENRIRNSQNGQRKRRKQSVLARQCNFRQYFIQEIGKTFTSLTSKTTTAKTTTDFALQVFSLAIPKQRDNLKSRKCEEENSSMLYAGDRILHLTSFLHRHFCKQRERNGDDHTMIMR